MKHGKLELQTLTFETGVAVPKTVGIRFNKVMQSGKLAIAGARVVVLLSEPLTLKAGDSLTVWLSNGQIGAEEMYEAE